MRNLALCALVCSCGGSEFQSEPPDGGRPFSDAYSVEGIAPDAVQDALGRVDDGDAAAVDAYTDRLAEAESGAACDLSACGFCTVYPICCQPGYPCSDGAVCRCGPCGGGTPAYEPDSGRCF
jgi:hypothetical protein